MKSENPFPNLFRSLSLWTQFMSTVQYLKRLAFKETFNELIFDTLRFRKRNMNNRKQRPSISRTADTELPAMTTVSSGRLWHYLLMWRNMGRSDRFSKKYKIWKQGSFMIEYIKYPRLFQEFQLTDL